MKQRTCMIRSEKAYIRLTILQFYMTYIAYFIVALIHLVLLCIVGYYSSPECYTIAIV